MLSATSFAFAQSGVKMHKQLMAKASTGTSAAHIFSGNKPVGENSVSSQSRNIASVNKSEPGTEPFDAVSREQDEDPDDISLAIINELKSEAKTDSNYESHKLKAEDLPLVISSGDRKTTGVVIPPFLYFKTQF